MENEHDNSPSDEERRTLWVGGIDSRVDEELLYELMLNAGPIETVTIPKDKFTLRAKSFAFVKYEYEESVAYAADLFCDTKLFGTQLRLQNKATGVGIFSLSTRRNTGDINSYDTQRSKELSSPDLAIRWPGNQRQESYQSTRQPNKNENHFSSNNQSPSLSENQTFNSPIPNARPRLLRPHSSPNLRTHQIRAVDMQMQQDLQQWQQNGLNSPGHLLNMYMNIMSSPEALSSPIGGSPMENPLLMGLQHTLKNIQDTATQNDTRPNNDTGRHHRGSPSNFGGEERRYDRRNHRGSPSNYGGEERRYDRSRSNDRNRSYGFNQDRRRR